MGWCVGCTPPRLLLLPWEGSPHYWGDKKEQIGQHATHMPPVVIVDATAETPPVVGGVNKAKQGAACWFHATSAVNATRKQKPPLLGGK